MTLAPTTTKLKDLPRWQLIERVVAVLEQSLSPDAEVKHDQLLPEILTGNLRQCDVVICSGSRFRRTVTIVEVQDRGRRVSTPTYDSWTKKAEKLGVQHLICVSVAGFTKPVIEDAARRGEMIRLMTLCEPGEYPPFLGIRSIDLRHDDVVRREIRLSTEVGEFPDATIDMIVETLRLLSFSSSDPLFVDSEPYEPFALDVVIQEMERLGLRINAKVTSISDVEEERRSTLEFPPDKRPLWMVVGEHRVPVLSADIHDRAITTDVTIPFQVLAYEQRNVNGTIAWIAPVLGKVKDKDLAINLVFLPQENGEISMAIHTALSINSPMHVLSDRWRR